MLRNISTLPVGTRFNVLNGDWEGYIEEWDGVKVVYIPFAPESISSFKPFRENPEDNILDIEVYNRETEEWENDNYREEN